MKFNMNRLKAIISILSAAAIFSCCLAGCAKPPEEEAVTSTEVYEVIKQNGELSTDADDSSAKSYTATSNNVVFTLSSYNEFNGNYGTMKNITVDNDSFSVKATCYCDIEMIYVGGKSDNMKIAYTAYDKDGNVVRDTFLQADLDDVKSGDTVTGVRFDIPYETASVVFGNFTGE